MNSEKTKTYKLRLSAKVTKYLTHIDKQIAKRILDKLEILKIDPYHASGVKPLSGQLAGLYRLRIGNYRAIYEINEDGYLVIVLVIGPRGDVYK